MNETVMKESQFFVGKVDAKNSEEGGIVDVLDVVLASSYARTPTTLRRRTDEARGVGVADFTLAPGYASTSTPPGTSPTPLTCSGTTAMEGATGVA